MFFSLRARYCSVKRSLPDSRLSCDCADWESEKRSPAECGLHGNLCLVLEHHRRTLMPIDAVDMAMDDGITVSIEREQAYREKAY